MHTIYEFVTGPLAWIAFATFILGSIAQLIRLYILTRKKDPVVLQYLSLKYGLRSILHWIIPFVPLSWKKNPALTVVTFIFHICLILVPIFLSAHVILWDQAWGIEFWTLSNTVADVMTVLVILACIFFAVRRATQPNVRFVTSIQDWIALIIVALPFISGFLVYHQLFAYKSMLIIHIISGELFLAAIPFTRLSHMFYAPLIRAYTGSEFGAVRQARDW